METLIRHTYKEGMCTACGKHMSRRSVSSAIREVDVYTTVRCHFTPTRMAAIRKMTEDGAMAQPIKA